MFSWFPYEELGKKTRECNPKKVILGRTYKYYVKEDYRSDILDDLNWRNFWDADPNVNVLWDIMLNIIMYQADVYSCC